MILLNFRGYRSWLKKAIDLYEFAGLAGLEKNNGQDSDYRISSQLSGYLRDEVVKRLPVVRDQEQSPSPQLLCPYGPGEHFQAKSTSGRIQFEIQKSDYDDRLAIAHQLKLPEGYDLLKFEIPEDRCLWDHKNLRQITCYSRANKPDTTDFIFFNGKTGHKEIINAGLTELTVGVVGFGTGQRIIVTLRAQPSTGQFYDEMSFDIGTGYRDQCRTSF